ncbi:MAG: carboxypeptidase regulatory-like domain-containing protein [Planctomycetes bacterium]|nr:carboxypeptidase regulatory-like domain-containing protein [Planctomycetota bacterium]
MNGKALALVGGLLAAVVGGAAYVLFDEGDAKPDKGAQSSTTTPTKPNDSGMTPTPSETNSGSTSTTPTTPVDVDPGTVRTATQADDYSAEGKLRVTGRVIDADTNKPVPDAEVEMLYPDGTPIESAFSVEDGTYEIEINEGIPPTVDFRAKAEGFSACVKTEVRVTKSVRDLSLDFALRPGFRIEGRVTSVAGGPVADAQVHVRSLAPMFEDDWETVDTDQNGYYSFEPIETFSPESFDVYVESIDHVPALKTGLSVASGQLTLRVDFRLVDSLKLRGRIVDSRGQPVEGATITIASPDPEYTDDAEDETSGEDGAFEYEGNVVPLESMFLLVTCPDYAPLRVESLPAAGADGVSDLGTLRLGAPVHVTGFVVMQGTGGVVGGGDITFCAVGAPDGAEGEYTDSTQIGSNGHFELDLENTPPGKVLVTIEAKDSLESAQIVDIANQPTVSLQLAVEPVIVISGSVTREADRSPIPSARVRIVGPRIEVDESELSARTRPDGSYRIELPSTVNVGQLAIVVEYAGKRHTFGGLPAPNAAYQIAKDFALDVPPVPTPQARAPRPGDTPRTPEELEARMKKMREEQDKMREELEKKRGKQDGG